MNPQTKIELTLGLINGILNYLGTRPYGEVFQIVQEIQAQAAPQVPVQEAAEPVEAAGLND